MIFISHSHLDKSQVAPIAGRLASHFGQNLVFYDSWSIKPGEGIISRADEALTKCKFFFFFVSNNSLKSDMVKLEWQSALFHTIKHDIIFIPVKLDNCDLPVIISQKRYIDLTKDQDVALREMINIIEGKDVYDDLDITHFNPTSYTKPSIKQHEDSALSVKVEIVPNGLPIKPHVSASHTLPVSIFFSLNNNTKSLIEYLRLHVWFHNRIWWDPEEGKIEPWQSEDYEKLPSDWSMFDGYGKFYRQMLMRSPADGFFLMNSPHPTTLRPPITVVFRPFIPMIPMPWKLEVPGIRPLTGAILFWMNQKGMLFGESVNTDIDFTELEQKINLLIEKEQQKK